MRSTGLGTLSNGWRSGRERSRILLGSCNVQIYHEGANRTGEWRYGGHFSLSSPEVNNDHVGWVLEIGGCLAVMEMVVELARGDVAVAVVFGRQNARPNS